MKSNRYWRGVRIQAQKEHIEVLQDHIETLKINLEAEKSMRKFYQKRLEPIERIKIKPAPCKDCE